MPSPLFTSEEVFRLLYHCGYTAATIQSSLSFGQPLPRETMFLIQRTIAEWSDEDSIPKIRQILEVLEKIECLKAEGLDYLVVNRVGSTEINPDNQAKLDKEYTTWANRLLDVLGVPAYAYSERFKKNGGVMVGNLRVKR